MDEMMKVQYLSMIQINNLQTLESESEHLPKTMIYQLWQAATKILSGHFINERGKWSLYAEEPVCIG